MLIQATGIIGDIKRQPAAVEPDFRPGMHRHMLGVIAVDIAADVARRDLQRAAAGEDIKGTEIKEMIERKKATAAAPEEDTEPEETTGEQEEETEEEHTKATLTQMQPSASDTDTTEEEKENARRLHALKMLEKYYIYLNEDDLRCLEAMLQDCKRRKLEYGALDCGSTI